MQKKNEFASSVFHGLSAQIECSILCEDVRQDKETAREKLEENAFLSFLLRSVFFMAYALVPLSADKSRNRLGVNAQSKRYCTLNLIKSGIYSSKNDSIATYYP